jgi:response regulator of citrate/malate metabolism
MKPIIVDSIKEMRTLGRQLFTYKHTLINVKRALRLYQKGWSYVEIGKEIQRSRMTVWRYLQIAKALEDKRGGDI